ncbi:MAG: phytoene desaturase family protein [Myxococcaceae bacterium]
MYPGTSFKQHPPSGPFDAIVIGSGVGGLACASALARFKRRRVLVLERHYRIGGYTHTFTRPGYEWDVGVHYLGQLGDKGAIRAVFDHLTDGSLRWARLPEVYDRIVLGERSYDLVAGSGPFIARLSEYFPADAPAITRYVELCRKAARSGQLFFLDRMLPGWLSGAAGPLLRRRFLAFSQRTTLDVLRELTPNEELIAVLTGQYGDYGLPPSVSSFAMHAALVAHYLGGAWYPIGGSSAIARAFAPVIEGAGGVLCHSAEVRQILVEGGRAAGVRLTSGEELRAPVVVSDAGAANTYGHLAPPEALPDELRAALEPVAPSAGYVCLYLGFKHTDQELGLTGTNLWLYPDRHHDQNVARFLADPSSPLPMVYASFPSAKDPSWSERFPGRATVELITLCPFEWVERWKETRWHHRGAEYGAFKARFTERLLEVLFRALPKLRGKVDVAELSTPLSTQHFAGHPRGELYGLDHSPARFRAPLRAETLVPGLYLTGADLTSAGVAGALLGGALSAGAIEGLGVLRQVLRRG